MAYEQSVRYLFSLLGSIRKENFGLERMQRLVAELGHPERGPGIIHVAGTNGKGSTAAMIEAGLLAAGHSTGFYSSPHLLRINERFRVNGVSASDDVVASAIEQVRLANERLVAQHGRSGHPTFFESATAVALCLFRDAGVDYRIIEVGLGGRLDASNVVEPEIAVITRIAFDHEGFLGSSLKQIAGEKAAIIKAGCRAVLGSQHDQARCVLLDQARDVGVAVVDAQEAWRVANLRDVDGYRQFEATSENKSIAIQLGLAGAHQVENAITAVAVLDALGVCSTAIAAGLREVNWPGRLELVDGCPRILLDAAHNPNGAQALAEFLKQQPSAPRVTLIYGSSREKAVDEVTGWLFPQVDHVILTRSRIKRALRPETLLRISGHHHDGIEVTDTLQEAIDSARSRCAPDDWIVIAGSVFLVGEARELLGCG